jgi:hypothetical protein
MPLQKKTTPTLAEVREQAVDTAAKLTTLRSKRQAALLADNAAALDTIDSEIAALEKAASRQAERIQLLEEQARQQEAEEIARKRVALIAQFAKTLDLADTKGEELQATLEKADRLFREVVKLRQEARIMWPAGTSHTNSAANTAEGAALSGGAVIQLLRYEICRVGSRPTLGGRPGEVKEPDFPGGLNPRPLDWAGTPDRITPLGAALRQASAFAVDMMKTQLDPIQALAPGQAVAPAEGDPRSAMEHRLAELLVQQNRLAADTSPEGEAAYLAVVSELERLSAEPQTGV